MSFSLRVDDTVWLEIIDYHHAEPLYELVKSNRIYLRQWLPWVDHMRTIDDFRKYIHNTQLRYAGNLEMGYVIIAQHKMIGRIGLYNIDFQNKHASIGYWIDEQYQGQGIMTRACKTLVEYCFGKLQLNRIEIRCGTENYKSQAIPQRLGFTKEGTIRQGEFVNNKFIDLFVFSMIKTEWPACDEAKEFSSGI